MKRAAIVAAALILGGCAPPKSKTVTQMETMRQEEAPDKLIDRGKAFATLGDNTRAEQYFSAAMDEGADPDKVLPLLLRVCVAEKRYRVAIDYAEPQLRRRPSNYRLRFVVASLYQTIGDTRTAREQLELVTQAKPDHADAHFALGVIFRDEDKDPVKADLEFREYLKFKPDGEHSEEAKMSLLKTVEPRQPLQDVVHK